MTVLSLTVRKKGERKREKGENCIKRARDIFCALDHSPSPFLWDTINNPKRCIFKAFTHGFHVIFIRFSFSFLIFSLNHNIPKTRLKTFLSPNPWVYVRWWKKIISKLGGMGMIEMHDIYPWLVLLKGKPTFPPIEIDNRKHLKEVSLKKQKHCSYNLFW